MCSRKRVRAVLDIGATLIAQCAGYRKHCRMGHPCISVLSLPYWQPSPTETRYRKETLDYLEIFCSILHSFCFDNEIVLPDSAQ